MSIKYDFISRSVGSVSTHNFDWDLEIYFKAKRRPGQYLPCYDVLSEILFDIAISASEELGYQIARCGARGDHRARLIAISVEELPTLPAGIRSDWRDMYGPSWRSGVESESFVTFRTVVTFSQTHSNDCLSLRLKSDFQSAIARGLTMRLLLSNNTFLPYCNVRATTRSEHGGLFAYSGKLPERAAEPEAFGFHESGLHPVGGLTKLNDPWIKTVKQGGPHLRLRAQFTLNSLSQLVGGIEASEALLETLISFGYQVGMLQTGKGYPAPIAHLRETCIAEAFTFRACTHQINVFVSLPLSDSKSLNQAQRRKLRFFVDKDIRRTFGLTSQERELPRPYTHAVLNNLFVDQFKSWEV